MHVALDLLDVRLEVGAHRLLQRHRHRADLVLMRTCGTATSLKQFQGEKERKKRIYGKGAYENRIVVWRNQRTQILALMRTLTLTLTLIGVSEQSQ